MACACAKKSAGTFSMRRPSRSLICETAISTAMPLVKPMTIETGIRRTSAPSLSQPRASSSTPASTVAISRLATP